MLDDSVCCEPGPVTTHSDSHFPLSESTRTLLSPAEEIQSHGELPTRTMVLITIMEAHSFIVVCDEWKAWCLKAICGTNFISCGGGDLGNLKKIRPSRFTFCEELAIMILQGMGASCFGASTVLSTIVSGTQKRSCRITSYSAACFWVSLALVN